jgi:small neutral amino acid transporter SnatA (MarC family)
MQCFEAWQHYRQWILLCSALRAQRGLWPRRVEAFAALTAGVHRPERKSLAARSITIAGVVLLLFALGGGGVLSPLRVSLPPFRVAGGVLLFLH